MDADTPLTLAATGDPDALLLNGDSEAHAVRVAQAYREIERRDGAALWHARAWRRVAWFLAGMLAVSVGVSAHLALKASRVQAFVQTVQLTEEGTMVLVGIPQDLLAYTPADGVWMDLAAQWVMKRQWKGDEESYKRTRNDWAWLFRHSCGLASKQLASDEIKEQPFKPSTKRASVEIKSITKTATPAGWQVVFREISVDKLASTLTEQHYIATLTVARLKPKTLAEAMDNRLGLCISGYDISPSTTKMP
jgi:hypothetical protein